MSCQEFVGIMHTVTQSLGVISGRKILDNSNEVIIVQTNENLQILICLINLITKVYGRFGGNVARMGHVATKPPNIQRLYATASHAFRVYMPAKKVQKKICLDTIETIGVNF